MPLPQPAGGGPELELLEAVLLLDELEVVALPPVELELAPPAPPALLELALMPPAPPLPDGLPDVLLMVLAVELLVVPPPLVELVVPPAWLVLDPLPPQPATCTAATHETAVTPRSQGRMGARIRLSSAGAR